jgi:hypothetical protein
MIHESHSPDKDLPHYFETATWVIELCEHDRVCNRAHGAIGCLDDGGSRREACDMLQSLKGDSL